MALKDMLQAGQLRQDLEATQRELSALKDLLAQSGRLELHEVQQALTQLQEQKAQVERELAEQQARAVKDLAAKRRSLEQEIDGLNAQLVAKRQEMVVIDEEILLQSFGFYKPRYALQNSEQYKVRLEQIRERQAAMVKAGHAATCPTSWTVNNSRREGERMIRDYTKLVVRSFNNECDASIVDVKFSNVEAVERRIRKAFEALNHLTERMSIALAPDYLDLKLQELYLCHEYQVKKQEEKEEQRRLREQLREEAKVAREIEEAKLRLAKEEKHFDQALAALELRLQQAIGEAERAALERERDSIQRNLAQIEKQKQDVAWREQNTRAGYVYVISNIGAFGDNVYKIGVTRRLEPRERIDELGDSSVPFGFDIHALIFSDDAPALETALHRAFANRRLNMINGRREFFNVTLAEIEAVVKRNFSKPVEFVRLPDAAEYRQSLKMCDGTVPRILVVT